MRRKPTNRTSYKEVCALYEKFGRSDYRLRSAEDILNIHGFDIRETDGYEDLTQEQKELFESYCVTHMNSLGMNTKIISTKFLGSGAKYMQIYNANSGTIESTAKSHGKSSSSNGHWIYPGTTLTIPG